MVLIDNSIVIDGVDISNMIAYEGVNWKRTDLEGPNAGTTISGKTIRDRIASKVRLDITCRPLHSDELNTLLNLIQSEFVSVTYRDPKDGRVTKTMYANASSASFMYRREHKILEQLYYYEERKPVEYWDGIEFSLVER